MRWNAISLGGRSYSHIMDPASQAPVGGPLASVSVVAPTAMGADGLATALMAAGEARGPALAAKLGVAALFLLVEDGGLRRIATGGFDVRLLG